MREGTVLLREVRPRPYRRGSPTTIERAIRFLKLDRIFKMVVVSGEALKWQLYDWVRAGETGAERIRQVIPGEVAPSDDKSVLLYAHYMQSGRVTDMVFRQLAIYRALGFQIIFITMSKQLDTNSVERLRKCCSLIVMRRSQGRDFGAWKDVWEIARSRFPSAEEFLLANDSVVGPISDLGPLFERLRTKEGMLGLTESVDKRAHLQSYLLLLRGKRAVDVADRFFSNLRLSHSKKKMILRGEIGISRFMMQEGVPVMSAFPYEEVETAALLDREGRAVLLSCFPGVLPSYQFSEDAQISTGELFKARRSLFCTSVNPTHYMWSSLVRLFDFPFIKSELLTTNPSEVPDISDWQKLVPLSSPTPVSEIEDHLAELFRPASKGTV